MEVQVLSPAPKQLSPEPVSGRLLFLMREGRESERGVPSEHAGSREQDRETFWSDWREKVFLAKSSPRHILDKF